MLEKEFNGITYKFLPYNVLEQVVRANKSIVVNQYCNSWTILNQGNDVITVNNKWTIYPGTVGTNNGEAKSVGGNFLELFKGEIEIAFAGVGNDPVAVVSQKVYLMDYNGR